MKNRNKYVNLATGLAFWVLNNGSILLTILSTYGLLLIRDFTVKEKDNKLKSITESLIALVILKGAGESLAIYLQNKTLSYASIIISVITFVLSIMMLKQSLVYLTSKLDEYDLKNITSKVFQSYYIVIVVDALLLLVLFTLVFTTIFPIPFLVELLSGLLSPNVNLAISLTLTFIKYFASRSFTKAAIMLTNVARIEDSI